MKTNFEKICFDIASQTEDTQREIMSEIKSKFSRDEYECIAIGVSYFRILLNPKLKRAMMEAVCSAFLGV